MNILLMAITATALVYGLKHIWPEREDLPIRLIVGSLIMLAVF